jgi:hypothetical protein
MIRRFVIIAVHGSIWLHYLAACEQARRTETKARMIAFEREAVIGRQ